MKLNENYTIEVKRIMTYNKLKKAIDHIMGGYDVAYEQDINDKHIYIFDGLYQDITIELWDEMYEDLELSEVVKYDGSEECYRKVYNIYKRAIKLAKDNSLSENKKINENMNKDELWCGIKDVYLIYRSIYLGPGYEVRYKDYICKESDLYEYLVELMIEDIEEEGNDWGDPDNDHDFVNFCKANPEWVKHAIIELSSGNFFESVKTIKGCKKLNESVSKKLREIKVAFIPHNAIKGYAEKLSDIEFLDLAATEGAIYNANDFTFAWNNKFYKYTPDKYFIRIIA